MWGSWPPSPPTLFRHNGQQWFMLLRESGKKLKFIDLLSDGSRLQLKLHAPSFSDPEQFHRTTSTLRRGDRIGRHGGETVVRSSR